MRIISLFERCLVACALYEDFWCRYAAFMEKHTQEVIDGKYSWYKEDDAVTMGGDSEVEVQDDDAKMVKDDGFGVEGTQGTISERTGGDESIDDLKREEEEGKVVKESISETKNGKIVDGKEDGEDDSESISARTRSQSSIDAMKKVENDAGEDGVMEVDDGVKMGDDDGCEGVRTTEKGRGGEEEKSGENPENCDENTEIAEGKNEEVEENHEEKMEKDVDLEKNETLDEEKCEEVPENVGNEEEKKENEKMEENEEKNEVSSCVSSHFQNFQSLKHHLTHLTSLNERVYRCPPLTLTWALKGVTWEDVRQVYRRACWVHCPGRVTLIMQWAEFEEAQGW